MNVATSTRISLPTVKTYGLTREELIIHLRVKPETVDGWLDGSRRRPQYFDAAVRAAKAGLHPISSALVPNYWKELGVERSQVRFWQNTGQTPAPARLAVAWIIHTKITGRG